MDVTVLCVHRAMVLCTKCPLAMLNFVAFHKLRLAFGQIGLGLDFELGLDNLVGRIFVTGRHLMRCGIDYHVAFVYMTK